MSPPSRCDACAVEIPAGADRCPRCLRKSTVSGARADRAAPGAAPRIGIERALSEEDDRSPAYIGVRVAATALAYCAFGPILWLIFRSEAWLDARGLWLAACVAALALATLPLRMAFAPSDGATSAASAGRSYGIRMAVVLAVAALLFLVNALAAQIVDDMLARIFLGLLLFLVALLVVLPLVAALLWKRPMRAALGVAAKGAGAAVVIVGLVAVISALRAARTGNAPAPLTIPADPKSLLDPLDLESVRVESIWLKDAGGEAALHLYADGGDFKRSSKKLVVTALTMIGAVRADPSASRAVTLWLPQRLDTPENRAAARDEERTINAALASADRRIASGRPIRVAFAFGGAPGR